MKIKNKKNKKPRGSPESDPRRQSLVTAVGSKRPGSLGWAAASPPLPARLIGVRRLRSEDGGEGGLGGHLPCCHGLMVVGCVLFNHGSNSNLLSTFNLFF